MHDFSLKLDIRTAQGKQVAKLRDRRLYTKCYLWCQRGSNNYAITTSSNE